MMGIRPDSLTFTYLIVFYLAAISHCDLFLYKARRQKRGDFISDFLGELDRAAQKFGAAVFGSNAAVGNFRRPADKQNGFLPRRGQQNQPLADFGAGNAVRHSPSASDLNSRTNEQRTIFPSLKSFWFCNTHPKNCEYLQCLAENFQHSDQAANIKQGSIALTDVSLRQALIDDPKILRIACDKVKLNDFQCSQFRALLGLANALDPVSAHSEDEPRDKRAAGAVASAPDYYDYLDGVAKAKKAGGGAGIAGLRKLGASSPGPSKEGNKSKAFGAIENRGGRHWPRDCNAILIDDG